jgi:hypothetical protein
MKRNSLGMLVAMALATPLVAAQDPQKTDPKEITLTGCVVQGSGPTVFLLDNARLNTEDPAEKGRTFLIVEATQDLNVKTHLDHEVTIAGKAEDKTQPTPKAGEKIAEKDLPKLQASSLTMVADRCTTAAK